MKQNSGYSSSKRRKEKNDKVGKIEMKELRKNLPG